MKKILTALALSGVISIPAMALDTYLDEEQVFFANDKSTTTDAVPDLADFDEPVLFVGRASTPASRNYNYHLGMKRAVWTAKTSGAPYALVKSTGEEFASGNQALDRRVDIVYSLNCSSYEGRFPCLSIYSRSFLRDFPQESRVSSWQH